MNWTAIGSIMLALAVGSGAFGAHLLQGRFDAYAMGIWERSVFYHFVHALGILIVQALIAGGYVSPRSGAWSAGLLLAGIVFFSGSLYALALTGVRTWGAVTPIGGTAFIAGWLVLAICALMRSSGS